MSDLKRVAPTPPMGWNSWDVYGASVTEAEVVANAEALAAQLKPHGWEYVVVDIQWSEPTATTSHYNPFVPLAMDEFSRLVPAVNRFPSAAGGVGFTNLAQRVHDLGLKFGIHVMRGIPRQAVHADTPVLGTTVRARSIASRNSICPWNTDMYGVDPVAPGAREYYDSLLALYASWGVDFIKVDDILLPYDAGEIELIRGAIDRCGRDIVLSLSCGPTDLAAAGHLRANAEMWRMTGDFWDRWSDLAAMFEFCDQWSAHVGDGHWPDADMLPVGHLAVRSIEHGVGERDTRLTRDEQVTMLTLWSIFRSPLMLGCDLTRLDAWTLALLTNDEVIRVLRESSAGRQLYRHGDVVAWVAADADAATSYLAVFNLGVESIAVATPVRSLGSATTVAVRDLWRATDLGEFTGSVILDVPSHGARLVSVRAS